MKYRKNEQISNINNFNYYWLQFIIKVKHVKKHVEINKNLIYNDNIGLLRIKRGDSYVSRNKR